MLSNELNSNPYSNIRVINYIQDIVEYSLILQKQFQNEPEDTLTPLEKIAKAEHLLRSVLDSEKVDVTLYAVNSDSESIQLDKDFQIEVF